MADSGSFEPGKAYIELYGKDDALKGTLAKNEKSFTTWGGSLLQSMARSA